MTSHFPDSDGWFLWLCDLQWLQQLFTFWRNIKNYILTFSCINRIRAETSINYGVVKCPPLCQCISRGHLDFFVIFGNGRRGAWGQHENKSILMIHSCWLQTFIRSLIVEIYWKIFYIQSRTTVILFLLQQPYLDIRLHFPFFCLMFLCGQNCWSQIVDLPILTESVLYEFVNPVTLCVKCYQAVIWSKDFNTTDEVVCYD